MVYLLNGSSDEPFPDVALALREPDGLLAAGGDLTVERLLRAYRNGIFPWYGWEDPILWWSPDPRMVLYPNDLHISKSLHKILKKNKFQITCNQAFESVIFECSKTRKDGLGTWIMPEVQDAFCQFHKAGYAHSIEAWIDDDLVGGLYGVLIGQMFFGESMFSRVSNASKVAFAHIVEYWKCAGLGLIDCQVHSDHLQKLGGRMIDRKKFVNLLDIYCEKKPAIQIPASLSEINFEKSL